MRGRKEAKANETIVNYSSALDSFKSAYIPIQNVVQGRSRGPEAEEFKKKLETANSELSIFLEDLFLEDISSLSARSSQITEASWREVATDLLYAFDEWIPMAVKGTEYKIAMLTSQGNILSTQDKARYIQRDIAQAIDFGSPDIEPINHHVYTLCEEKLLHTLIVTLIDTYPRLTRKQFKDYCLILAVVFTLFLKWSHQDGPFKRFTQHHRDKK